MKSLKTPLLTKSFAAAIVTTGLAAAAVAATVGGPIIFTPDIPNTPDNGMACRSAPNAYLGTLVNNTVFCKRTKNHLNPLTCSDPGFQTKVIREGPNGGGKDICAAPNRNYTSNSPLIGTEGIDYKFVEAGSTQVSTIVANQRQFEATATGDQVDARALSSAIVVNHPSSGSEDKLTVEIEFSTFPKTVGGFVPRPLP
jgi:hypothetical protein